MMSGGRKRDQSVFRSRADVAAVVAFWTCFAMPRMALASCLRRILDKELPISAGSLSASAVTKAGAKAWSPFTKLCHRLFIECIISQGMAWVFAAAFQLIAKVQTGFLIAVPLDSSLILFDQS